MAQVRKPKQKRRPINVDPETADLLNIIALYERKSVAEVCRPLLQQPVLRLFAKLPEAIREMATRNREGSVTPSA